MHVLWMMIVGVIVGLARQHTPQFRAPGGLLISLVVAVAGAVLGGTCARSLGWAPLDVVGIVLSTIGARMLLGMYRLAAGPDDGWS